MLHPRTSSILTPNMSRHVASGWPNAPTLLRYFVQKCCDRLAGARKYWANNVGICCVIICCDRLARAYKDLCWKVLEPLHRLFYAHRLCMNSIIAMLLLVGSVSIRNHSLYFLAVPGFGQVQTPPPPLKKKIANKFIIFY